MSGTTIGEVNINLRMSLAQFKTDTQDGTRAASAATKQMADEVGKNSHEASASLALIGEEIGVNIPRHIRSFITAIPGVGTALNAAFSSVAIIAVITVITELVQKLQEFRKAAEETAAAGEKVRDSITLTGLSGREAIADLQARFIGITQGPIAEMESRLNHVNELFESMKLSDTINRSFDDLAKSVKGVFYEIGSGVGSDALKSFKGQFDDILKTQGRPAALQAVVDEIQRVNEEMETLRRNGDQSSNNEIVSFQKYVTALTALQATLDSSLTVAAQKRKADSAAYAQARVNAETDANNKIIAARNQEVEQLESLEAASAGVLNKNLSAQDQEILKLNALIDGWTDYKAKWEAAHNGISAVANAQIEALRKEVDLLKAEADSAIDSALKAAHGANEKNVNQILTTPTPALYSGTKEAADLYKIQHDSAAAIAEAQKVYTATRTAAQQYAQQIDVLNVLLQQGRIDQDTYNRAVAEAKQKYDSTTIAVRQFGTDVAETLKTGALWGSSWKDALESIAIELTQLILKMTLLKSLQESTAASGGGGIGGFFSTLLGGLFGGGKASGGPVQPGQYYEWQEKGHEYFAPGVSGSVIPAGALQGAGGGPTINNFSFNGVQDFDSFKKSKDQLASDMVGMMARASRRNR